MNQQPVTATKQQAVSAMKHKTSKQNVISTGIQTSTTKQTVSTGILNRNVESFIFDRVSIILWAAIGCARYPSKLGFVMLVLADLRYFINFILCYYPDGALNGRLYVKEIIPELGLRMTFRLDWYPGEQLVFWIERSVIYMQFLYLYVMEQNLKGYELDHRILQYSCYVVFTATNVFYLLSAYPDLLQRDPQFARKLKGKPQEEEAELVEQVWKEKPEKDNITKVALRKQVQKEKLDEENTAKMASAEPVEKEKQVEGQKEMSELSKLKEENERLISENIELNDENEKLYSEQNKLNETLNELSLELADVKSQNEAYEKLISQNEGVQGKYKEEQNKLLNELNAAKATCETYLSLLRNLGG